MTRIAVTADIHADDLGSRLDPASGLNARFLESVDMVRWIAQDAKARECRALIVLGDFTENRHPAPWRVAMIREALTDGPDVQVYLRGNHDGSVAGRSIVSVLADERNRIGVTSPQIVKLASSARTTVALCLAPYLDRHWLRSQPGFEHTPDAEVFRILAEQYLAIARGLYIEAQELRPQRVIFAGHQTINGGQMSETQQAFLGDLSLVVDGRALAAVGYDAVLFGHLHRHQVLARAPLIAYPGSPSRVDFGEALELKGYMVLDTDDPSAFEFVETPARRFVTLTGGCGYEPDVVRNAIVRCVDVDPELDAANLRSMLEVDGAFEVVEIRRRPVEAPEIAGGLSETLSPADALAAYFDGDPDRDELCALGRELLTEAAA